jgi:hypothetical protein
MGANVVAQFYHFPKIAIWQEEYKSLGIEQVQSMCMSAEVTSW